MDDDVEVALGTYRDDPLDHHLAAVLGGDLCAARQRPGAGRPPRPPSPREPPSCRRPRCPAFARATPGRHAEHRLPAASAGTASSAEAAAIITASAQEITLQIMRTSDSRNHCPDIQARFWQLFGMTRTRSVPAFSTPSEMTFRICLAPANSGVSYAEVDPAARGSVRVFGGPMSLSRGIALIALSVGLGAATACSNGVAGPDRAQSRTAGRRRYCRVDPGAAERRRARIDRTRDPAGRSTEG